MSMANTTAIFLDSFTERQIVVEYNGRRYHFEFVKWCGWCAALPNGNGSPKRDHPKGAWNELYKELNIGDDTEEL